MTSTVPPMTQSPSSTQSAMVIRGTISELLLRIRTGAVCSGIVLASPHESGISTFIRWNPGQNPAELDQTIAYTHTSAVDAEFPDRVLVRAGPLLDDRRGA